MERAKGGVSLIVTGGVSPNDDGVVFAHGTKLDTIEEAEKHKVITKLYMRLVENRNANFAWALFLSSK